MTDRIGPGPAEDRGRTGLPLRVAINLAGPLAFIATYLAIRQLVDATWGLLGGSALSIAAGWVLDRRIAPLPLVLGLLAAIFGALTLIFHDSGFIKLETSIRSAAVGLAIVVALLLGYNPLKVIAGRLLTLADAAWRSLAWRTGLFNIAVAILNAVLWATQPDAVWATFKFPVLPVLHGLFWLAQVPLIMTGRREAERPEARTAPTRTRDAERP